MAMLFRASPLSTLSLATLIFCYNLVSQELSLHKYVMPKVKCKLTFLFCHTTIRCLLFIFSCGVYFPIHPIALCPPMKIPPLPCWPKPFQKFNGLSRNRFLQFHQNGLPIVHLSCHLPTHMNHS